MFWRYRYRKDIIISVLLVILFGVGLYYLNAYITGFPELVESSFITWAFRLLLLVYLLLLFVTIKQVFTTYDLERFDPGSRSSMKRLLKRMRYRLQRGPIKIDEIMHRFDMKLKNMGYDIEFDNSIAGRVYVKTYAKGLLGRSKADRVMIKKHDALNVILVDQILQDCIRFIQSLRQKPSNRNILIIVTETVDPYDTASAAAGVVNFLGKFPGGSLGPMLLSCRHNRLFYPADRTILPRRHRYFQNRIRRILASIIRHQKKQMHRQPVVRKARMKNSPDDGENK